MIVRAVIDLLNGKVVRGVKGQRDAYCPIQSCLTQSTAPDDIALAIFESTGIEHFYLADLDSIIHKKIRNGTSFPFGPAGAGRFGPILVSTVSKRSALGLPLFRLLLPKLGRKYLNPSLTLSTYPKCFL